MEFLTMTSPLISKGLEIIKTNHRVIMVLVQNKQVQVFINLTLSRITMTDKQTKNVFLTLRFQRYVRSKRKKVDTKYVLNIVNMKK